MPSQLEMYIAAQTDLLKEHAGKIIAVKDGTFCGEFKTKTDALNAMLARGYAPGTFIVIRCSEGDGEYTRRFRSRLTPNMGQTAWANL